MNWVLIKAVLKAKRRGLLHLVPAKGPTCFVCLADQCGKCCRTIGTPIVTAKEAERIDPEWLVKDKNAIFVKSNRSTCCLLKDCLCSIHSIRPKSCWEYPWYNIAGTLYYDTGCPGIKHDRDERPDVNDIQPFEGFFPGMPKFVLGMIRKICVK